MKYVLTSECSLISQGLASILVGALVLFSIVLGLLLESGLMILFAGAIGGIFALTIGISSILTKKQINSIMLDDVREIKINHLESKIIIMDIECDENSDEVSKYS